MNYFDKVDDPRRRWLIQALGAGYFSTRPMAQALAQVLGSRPEKLPEGRSIYRVQGRVLVDGKEANLQTPVTPTSTIETPANGEIVYVQNQNSYIQRGSSRVVLERAEKPEGGFAAGLRVLTGALLSVFPRGSPMTLKTKTATVGIRGTGVYLEADEEQTYFCTCYGVADIAANEDPQSKDTVAANHHDRPLYILAKEPKGRNIRKAPFINHTDQELMLIETLVGRKPPFIFPKDDYGGPRRDY
jgi:hypothetical protein